MVKEFALNGVVGVNVVGFSLAENRASKEGTANGPMDVNLCPTNRTPPFPSSPTHNHYFAMTMRFVGGR